MDYVKRRSSELERRIAEILEKEKIPFTERVSVGGVPANFLILTADGRSIIVEAKGWPATESNMDRAIQQVKLYQEAIGVDGAIIVLEDLKHGRPAEGLVNEKELVDLLSLAAQSRGSLSGPSSPFSFGTPLRRAGAGLRRESTSVGSEKTIFAAMPFSNDYDDTYFVAMAYAADSVGAVCRRVDREDFQGDIVDEIKRLIRGCVAVIADLSESKPNVLYETGFAHALNLPTVHICCTSLDRLPFDVRNWNTILYSKGQTHSLRDVMAKRLAGLLKDTSSKE
jgi:hypothetical protein